MATKRKLRQKAAVNKAGSLVASGVGKANISKLSSQTLSSALSKTRKNTPQARSIAAELARRPSKTVRKRKKR